VFANVITYFFLHVVSCVSLHVVSCVCLSSVRYDFVKKTCSGLKKWGMETPVWGEARFQTVVEPFLSEHKNTIKIHEKKAYDKIKAEDPRKEIMEVKLAVCMVKAWGPNVLAKGTGRDHGVFGKGDGKPGNVGVNKEIMCNFCSKTERALQACSRCKNVKYCCKECQVKDWKSHKAVCVAVGKK
jgi:hypothetical protein